MTSDKVTSRGTEQRTGTEPLSLNVRTVQEQNTPEWDLYRGAKVSITGESGSGTRSRVVH